MRGVDVGIVPCGGDATRDCRLCVGEWSGRCRRCGTELPFAASAQMSVVPNLEAAFRDQKYAPRSVLDGGPLWG